MKKQWSSLVVAASSVLLAGSCSCTGGEPSDPWADLSGTIYVLRGFPGPLAAVDPRSGDLRPVPGMPLDLLSDLAAPMDGRVLVVGNGRIFLFNPATQQIRTILDDQETNGDVSVESATLRLAYRRTDPNGVGLFARDTFSTAADTLVPPSRDEFLYSATWMAPTELVFVRNNITMGPARRLWRVRSDGAGLRPFGGDTGWIADGLGTASSTGPILFFRFAGDTTVLSVTDTSASTSRILATITPAIVAEGAWSPDRRYLALCSQAAGPTVDLELLHVATGARRILRDDSGDECAPTWVQR